MPPSLKVASYATEFLDLFISASKKPFPVIYPSVRMADYQRQRLYNLRKALAHEGHPMLKVAQSVQIRVRENSDGTALFIAEPLDMDLVAALRAAGLSSAAPEPPPITPDDIIDEILADDLINEILEDEANDETPR